MLCLQQFLTNCLKLYSQVRTMRFGSFQGYCGAYIITHIDMTVLNCTWGSKTVEKDFVFTLENVISLMHFGCEVSHFPNCTVVKVTLSAHTPTRYNMKKSTNSDLFYSNVTHFSFSTRNVILSETKHSVFSLPPHSIHSLDKGHEIIYRKQLLPLLLKVGVQSQSTSLCPMIMCSIEFYFIFSSISQIILYSSYPSTFVTIHFLFHSDCIRLVYIVFKIKEESQSHFRGLFCVRRTHRAAPFY